MQCQRRRSVALGGRVGDDCRNGADCNGIGILSGNSLRERQRLLVVAAAGECQDDSRCRWCCDTVARYPQRQMAVGAAAECGGGGGGVAVAAGQEKDGCVDRRMC